MILYDQVTKWYVSLFFNQQSFLHIELGFAVFCVKALLETPLLIIL